MILGVLLGLWLATWASGETPIGRALRRWVVERPAAGLSRISRGQVLLVLTLTGVAVALIWLLENDGRMLIAMGLPDVLSLAVAIDAASLLDLALVAVIAVSTIRVRAVVTWLRPRATRRPRARSIRIRRARPPANDDEERPALAA